MPTNDPDNWRTQFHLVFIDVLREFDPGGWFEDERIPEWEDKILDVLAEYGDHD